MLSSILSCSSILLSDVMDLQQRQQSGMGWYAKKAANKKHVVVTGGAVSNFNREALDEFILQLCKTVSAHHHIAKKCVLESSGYTPVTRMVTTCFCAGS